MATWVRLDALLFTMSLEDVCDLKFTFLAFRGTVSSSPTVVRAAVGSKRVLLGPSVNKRLLALSVLELSLC